MDRPPQITITAFGKTDVGLVREHNEDNLLIADVSTGLRLDDPSDPVTFELGPKGALLLVCDGMGGAAAGEVASRMAVESIAGVLESAEPLERDAFARRLRHAVEDANDRIFVQSRDNQSERGMGTTCTSVAFIDSTLIVGQIGDSRAYVMRRGRLSQVTKDQSLAWQLMEAGAMTAEEAKGFEHANIILQALGVQERVEVVMSQVALRQGDIVLVSSDGLHGPVSDEEIADVLSREPDLKKACDLLIARALEREGPDNVSVVLARFEGEDLREPTEEEIVEFVSYDPGYDRNDPPRLRSDLGEKVTVEVTVPKEAIRFTGSHDPLPPLPGSRLGHKRARSEASSVMSFVLLTLFAAAAAGAFIKCDQGGNLQHERRAAALNEAAAEAAAARRLAAPEPALETEAGASPFDESPFDESPFDESPFDESRGEDGQASAAPGAEATAQARQGNTGPDDNAPAGHAGETARATRTPKGLETVRAPADPASDGESVAPSGTRGPIGAPAPAGDGAGEVVRTLLPAATGRMATRNAGTGPRAKRKRPGTGKPERPPKSPRPDAAPATEEP